LTIARNRAIDRLRSMARAGEQALVPDDRVAVFDLSPDPEAQAVSSQQAAQVRQALRLLPVEERRAIEAAFFGELSHSEVADHLNAPLGTVKTRIRSGLGRLRNLLGAAQAEGA
jgi:RNA polymerase sigma-70 factor (ECF subfamily)